MVQLCTVKSREVKPMRPFEWLERTTTYRRLQIALGRSVQHPSADPPGNKEEQPQHPQEQPHNTPRPTFGDYVAAAAFSFHYVVVGTMYYGYLRHHYKLFAQAKQLAQSESREDKENALVIFSKIAREHHDNKAARYWRGQVRDELEKLQTEQPENSQQNSPTP